jgi:hypothetical protein
MSHLSKSPKKRRHYPSICDKKSELVEVASRGKMVEAVVDRIFINQES